MFRTDPAQAKGLLDFWEVYEANYDAIQAETLVIANRIPDFASLIAQMSPEIQKKQNDESRERLKLAVHGDWKPYEDDLRVQGASYAKLGIRFGAWHELMGAFSGLITPFLVKAYIGERERL